MNKNAYIIHIPTSVFETLENAFRPSLARLIGEIGLIFLQTQDPQNNAEDIVYDRLTDYGMSTQIAVDKLHKNKEKIKTPIEVSIITVSFLKPGDNRAIFIGDELLAIYYLPLNILVNYFKKHLVGKLPMLRTLGINIGVEILTDLVNKATDFCVRDMMTTLRHELTHATQFMGKGRSNKVIINNFKKHILLELATSSSKETVQFLQNKITENQQLNPQDKRYLNKFLNDTINASKDENKMSQVAMDVGKEYINLEAEREAFMAQVIHDLEQSLKNGELIDLLARGLIESNYPLQILLKALTKLHPDVFNYFTEANKRKLLLHIYKFISEHSDEIKQLLGKYYATDSPKIEEIASSDLNIVNYLGKRP